MAKKKKSEVKLNLDSFLDIMTCLVGVLILIILLTGVDASQIKVLIPTPIGREVNKRPVFVECRSNQLYRVDIDNLRQLANKELRTIAQEAGADRGKMLLMLADRQVGDEYYEVDLTFATVGQFAINPKPGKKGYTIERYDQEKATDWFGSILTSIVPEEEMITFLVRDDSYRMFKLARHLAWTKKVDVSYELLDSDGGIKFGLGGSRSLAQ